MRRLAIIPARGGSKRIPRKNIRPFCGKPMLAWPIEAALESGCFSRVLVSTDDAEIAEAARACGAEVPFMRPAQLADDYCGTQAVVQHALRFCAAEGDDFTQVACIYATAPLLSAAVIRAGAALLAERPCDYAVTVTGFSFPVQRSLLCADDGYLKPFFPEHMPKRSQDLPRAYHDAGQLYWGLPAAFLQDTNLWSMRVAPLFLPELQVQDIDTEQDWQLAEMKFRLLRGDQRGQP